MCYMRYVVRSISEQLVLEDRNGTEQGWLYPCTCTYVVVGGDYV